MRVAVIGAGLGGLAVALRLQGAGCEVTVLEQRDTPGGRASQLRTDGYTWDTGPSLITMPWVLEETFAAGGPRPAPRGEPAPPRSALPDPLGGEEPRTFDFGDSPERLREQVARFSERDARRVDDFLAALKPIYEQGILGAGQRPFGDLRSFAALVPAMVRLRALGPLHRFVSRFFEHPRVREAFSFHSLFIGGDPFRVPAIYGALVYLQVLDGGWYTDGGVYSVVEAMARPLDVRCGARGRGDRDRRRAGAGGAPRRRGADRGRRGRLQRRRAAHERAARPRRRSRGGCARRCRACCSTWGSTGPATRCCTTRCWSAGLPRLHPHRHARPPAAARPSRPTCTRRRAPRRRWRRTAATRSRCCCPCPTCARRSTGRGRRTGCATRWSADMEQSFGLDGLGAAVRVEHRMAPAGLRPELGAVDGNAFAIEPTLHQSAYFRAAQPRARRRGPLPRRRRHPSRRGHPRRAARRRGHRGSGDGRRAGEGGGAAMSAGARPAPVGSLRRGRSVPRRPRSRRRARPPGASRARSRWPAGCCRPRSATTSTCSTSCSARSTTSSTSGARRRPSASRRSRHGPRGGPGPSRPRPSILDDARRAPPAPARRDRRLLRGHARRPRRRGARDRGGGRPLLLPRRRHGRAW